MTIDSLIGIWLLVASTSINGEIAFIENKPNPNGVKNWLGGSDETLLNNLTPTTALKLTISNDGSFREEKVGKPKVYWFDAEGVLKQDVTPFDGHIEIHKAIAYLKPQIIPSWAIPIDKKYGLKLRYDDGDTKIVDRIERLNNRLVRTVNVVTDELYTDRVIIVYEQKTSQ